MSFIEINKITPKETFPGFQGRFFHASSMTIAHWDIKAGAVAPIHTHIHEQTVDVIQGELEMTVGNETRILKAGMGAIIPSMVPHGAKGLTDCKVIDTFCPVREDYR